MFDAVLDSIVELANDAMSRRSWEEVDHALRELARSRSALDADEARLLAIAVRDEIWRKLGRGSLLEYLEDVLGYSPRQASERVRVAKELAAMPQLEDALATNALHWSAVRELSRVAIPTTVDRWLDAARGKNLRQIEALVAGHEKGDEPDDPIDPDLELRKLALLLRPETIARLRVGRQQLEGERGEPVDDDTLIATLLRAYLEGADSESERGLARFQIMTVLCPTCEAAGHEAAGRRYPVDATSREIALCDAQWIGSDRAPARATQDVTPMTRQFVHRRDAGKCTVPDCRASRFIDVHHIVPRSAGGSHDAENLTLLCEGHHRALHDGKLTITGKAPQLEVRWNIAAPDTDVHARIAAPHNDVRANIAHTVTSTKSRTTTPTARSNITAPSVAPANNSAPAIDAPANPTPPTARSNITASPVARVNSAAPRTAPPTSTIAAVPTPSELAERSERVRDAKQALVQLRYPRPIADAAVETVWREHGPDIPLERLIFFSLRSLSTQQSKTHVGHEQ